MAEESQINEVTSSPFGQLREPSAEEIRYSAGFLRCNFTQWFPDLAADWVPFFHSVGAELGPVRIRCGFDYPDTLSRVIPLEVEGELAIVGMDAETESALTQAVIPEDEHTATDIILEYLERRLASSLTRAWRGTGDFSCNYMSITGSLEAEIQAVVCLDFELSGKACTVWFGIGPRVLERFDLGWRSSVRTRPLARQLGDEVFTVRFELCELSLSPDALIDYMRSGSRVSLETGAPEELLVRIGEQAWAKAELCIFKGRYAARITEFLSGEAGPRSDATRVSVSVAETVLDRDAIAEQLQIGAYILSGTGVGDTATLSISGERVGTGSVTQSNEGLVLNILPKS